jgi:CHAT domain-containing protein/tetratricopeptide (TPR) repeat protein
MQILRQSERSPALVLLLCLLNLTASAFPAVSRGVSERISNVSSLQIEDSLPHAAGSFSFHGPVRSAESRSHAHYVEGLHCMGRGEYDRAIAIFGVLAGDDPLATRACLRIYECFKFKHDLSGGRRYFREWMAKKPENAYFYHGLGLILSEDGDWQGALEQFQSALKRDPHNIRGYFDLIDAYQRLQLPAQGEKDLKNRLRNDPHNVAVCCGLAYAYQARDRLTEALEQVNRAEMSGENRPEIDQLKALIFSRMTRYRELIDVSLKGLKQAEKDGDLEYQSAFQTVIGMGQYFLSNYAESLDRCGRSLQLSRAIGSKVDEIRSLEYMGHSYRDIGRPEEALESANLALEVCLETGDRKRLGYVYRLIGTVNPALEARALHRKALAIAIETGDERLKSMSLGSLGNVSWELGEFPKALEYLGEALSITEKQGNRIGQQMCLSTMGLVYWNLGRYTKALGCHEKALDIARKHELKIWEGVHLGNIAVLFQDMGDDSTALAYHGQAMRIAVETGSKGMQAIHLGNMAGIHLAKFGRTDVALDYYRKAVLLARETRDKRLESDFLGNIGELFITTGRLDEAESNIRRALEIAKEARHRGGEAWQCKNLGNLHILQKDFGRAAAEYGQALSIGRKLAMPVIVIDAYTGLGSVAEKRGRFRQALRFYRNAIAEIENFRGLMDTEEFRISVMEREFGIVERILRLLWILHRENPKQGYDRESFDYAERIKARTFLDILSQANIFQNMDDIPGEFRESVVSNDSRLRERYQSLSDALNGESSTSQKAKVLQIERQIESLRRERSGLIARLEKTNPEYYRLTHPGLLTARQVRDQILGDHQVLVEYFIGDSSSYAWVLSKNGMEWHAIALNRVRLESSLAGISPLFRREKGDGRERMDHRWANLNTEALHRMYRELLRLPAGGAKSVGDELIIVPDDLLNYFPFEILVTDTANGRVRYLIEEKAIHYASSASLLAHESEKGAGSGKELLAFGNPYFGNSWLKRLMNPGEWFKPGSRAREHEDFQPLPNAEKEVRAIGRRFKRASIFTGKNATENRFKAEAGDFRYIHLATHFLISDVQPMVSKIVLSRNQKGGEDGFLQMYEVYNLKLKAELAILSGCNSGLGKFRRGEGLIGLSRAFFYAGAGSLMVSLWPVEDQSAARLMQSFYANLGAGKDKAEALRQAKVEMIHAPDEKRNPFYWGSFVLIESHL